MMYFACRGQKFISPPTNFANPFHRTATQSPDVWIMDRGIIVT